jgi:hypothetical protein
MNEQRRRGDDSKCLLCAVIFGALLIVLCAGVISQRVTINDLESRIATMEQSAKVEQELRDLGLCMERIDR